MANPDTACITYKLSLAPYRSLFEEIWGAGSLSSITRPADVASVCATPEGAAEFGSNTQPVVLSTADRTLSDNDYLHSNFEVNGLTERLCSKALMEAAQSRRMDVDPMRLVSFRHLVLLHKLLELDGGNYC